MKALCRNALLSAACLMAVSCTTLAHYTEIDDSVRSGDFPGAYARMQGAKEKAYSEKDKILYYLDAGMLAHYAGVHSESIDLLTEAERAIEEAYTKSVSAEAATLLVNDNTNIYPGEDYEDLYVNVFKALEYSRTGAFEDGMVEIRRLDNKLKYLSTKYDAEMASARESESGQAQDLQLEMDTTPIQFTNSALADYLSMVFYRSEGKLDDARVDRNRMLDAFARSPSIYHFPVPKSVSGELEVPAGQARLNIVSFEGLAPVKREEAVRIRVTGDRWMKIALPVMESRPSAVAATEVVFSTGERYRLEELEDMSAVARDTFRLRANLIYLKTVLRSLAKTASSVALEAESNRARDAQTSNILSIMSIVTQAYSEFSEQADLRISHYFPGRASVLGLNLPPGKHSFAIRYLDAAGRVIATRSYEDFEVSPKGPNLVEAVCLE